MITTTRRLFRNRRPPAVLAAILLGMIVATGGCTVRGTPTALMPVSTTAPLPAAAEPAVHPLARPATPPPASTPILDGSDVTAIGDSIMVDGTPNLRSLLPGIAINAVAGRQVATGLAIMETLARLGQLRPSIVIELGTNGELTPAQLDRFLSLAAGRHLVLLTNHCPYCSWVPPNNDLMAATCTAQRACTVADWESLAQVHPSWFFKDRVHLPFGGAGAEAFAELISNALAGHVPHTGRPIRAGQAR